MKICVPMTMDASRGGIRIVARGVCPVAARRTFEGPLDLLLHLIKQNEVNIYDIPIALITEQYLEYLDLMQELDLDVAGEFLVMAATLIHIKSRMLLPRPEPAPGRRRGGPARGARAPAARAPEVSRQAAELLHERETVRSAQWQRPDDRVAPIAGDEYEPELEVDLFSLLAAFKAVLERAKRGRRWRCPPSRSRSRGGSSSCSRGSRRPRRAASRTSSPTCRHEGRPDRHVPRAARDDSAEAGARVPGRRVRRHPRLQVEGRRCRAVGGT